MAPEPMQAVGVLVLEPDNSMPTPIEAAEAGWTSWRIRPGGQGLPDVVLAVASRARTTAAGDARWPTPALGCAPVRDLAACARVDARRGPDARSVVILEPARTPELAPLVARPTA